MTTKEYLQQGYRLARGVRFKRERILELRELAGSSTSSYTAVRLSGTQRRSKLENCICEIDELSQEINEAVGQLRNIRNMVKAVDNLDYRHLLELRYVRGCSWPEVAKKMHYSERHIYNLHGKALKHFSELQCLDMV